MANISEQHGHDAAPGSPREPQLFRFGLRRLFFFVSGATAFIALLASCEGVWPWVILFSATLVAAHVLGNAVGTRLRDSSRDVQIWKAGRPSRDRDEPVATRQPVPWAELSLPVGTPLALHGTSSWRRNGAVAAGAVLGLALGASGIHLSVGDDVTWIGLAVGSISCAVMGGWFALLATNFCVILRHAWRHAAK